LKITRDNLVKIEDDPLESFYQGFKSPVTKTSYTRKLRKILCEYLEDILEGSFENRASQLVYKAKEDPQEILRILLSLSKILRERTEKDHSDKDYLNPSSFNNFFKPIKKLLDMNGIGVAWKRIYATYPEQNNLTDSRGYTLKEIQTMLQFCDAIERAIILTASSSGARVGGLEGLKWEDVIPVHRIEDRLTLEITESEVSKSEIMCAMIMVYKHTKDEYPAFITPEAYNAILNYRTSWINETGKEPEHISLELVSQANQGFFENIQTNSGTSIPVSSGDWSMTASSQGKEPVIQDVRIYQGQTTAINTNHQNNMDKGIELYDLGKYEEAITYFKKALEIDPNNAHALNNIGRAYAQLADYEIAKKYFEQAIQIDPNYQNALSNLGHVYQILGKYEEAIKYYEESLKINPNNIEVIKNTGYTLSELDKHEESIEYFKKALEIDPNDANVLNYMGVELGKLGKYEEANKAFDKALEIDPNNSDVLKNKKILDKLNGAMMIIPLTGGTCTVDEKCKIKIATVNGGSPPYTFQSDTFVNGAPPMGMIVDLDGYLTGTPSREGTYNVGVCVVDGVGKSDCNQVTVIVNPSDEQKSSGIRYCMSNVFNHKLSCADSDYDGKWKDTVISGKMYYCIASSEDDWKCK